MTGPGNPGDYPYGSSQPGGYQPPPSNYPPPPGNYPPPPPSFGSPQPSFPPPPGQPSFPPPPGQPGFPPPPGPPGNKTNIFAIVSLVLGVVGVVGFFCCNFVTFFLGGIFGALPAVAGLVMGIVALNQIKKSQEQGVPQQGRGLAIGGIATSGVAVALGVGWLVFIAIAAATSG